MYTLYTYGTSKILKTYDSLKNLRSNQQQKESTQNLFLNKNEKSSCQRKFSVFFQQDQTTITDTSHKGFAWLKHKKTQSQQNYESVTKQNRKQIAKINSLGCLPTSAIV